MTVLTLCDYPFAIFYADEMCLRTYMPFYTYTMYWSLAYFAYDIILMVFVLKRGGAFTTQSVIHHVVMNFGGYLLTKHGGHAMPIIA